MHNIYIWFVKIMTYMAKICEIFFYFFDIQSSIAKWKLEIISVDIQIFSFEFSILMYENSWYLLRYSIHSKRANDETRRIKGQPCSFHTVGKNIFFLFVVVSRGSWKVVNERSSELSFFQRRECDAPRATNMKWVFIQKRGISERVHIYKSAEMIKSLINSANNKITVIMHSNII